MSTPKGIKRKVRKARRAVAALIAEHAKLEGRFAGALSAEGYNGGYQDALDDVLLALEGVNPQRHDFWDTKGGEIKDSPTDPTRPFRRGLVEVLDREDKVIGTAIVVSITPRRVITADGRRWSLLGERHDGKRAWPFPRIRPLGEQMRIENYDVLVSQGRHNAEVLRKWGIEIDDKDLIPVEPIEAGTHSPLLLDSSPQMRQDKRQP